MKYVQYLIPLLTTFSVFSMDIVIPTEQATQTIDIYLITPQQIVDYIQNNAGINLPVLIQKNLEALNLEEKKRLSLALVNLFPLIENGFNKTIPQKPSQTTTENLTEIADILGFGHEQALSLQALDFYKNSVTQTHTIESGNADNEIVMNLTSTDHDLYSDILHAVYKIMYNTLIQNKSLYGVLLVHNKTTQQIIITAAPQQKTSKFNDDNLMSLGEIALHLAQGISNLTETDNKSTNTDVTAQEKTCLAKIHPYAAVLSAVLITAISIWQYGTEIYNLVHGPVNSTLG